MAVESNNVWNERQSEVAIRLMDLAERTADRAERNALARASERLFWNSVGAECPRILRERASMANDAPSPMPGGPANTRSLG